MTDRCTVSHLVKVQESPQTAGHVYFSRARDLITERQILWAIRFTGTARAAVVSSLKWTALEDGQ